MTDSTTNNPSLTAFATNIPAGPGGQAFDDRADAGDRRVTGIESVDLWVDAVVMGLQVTYTLAGGGRYQAPLRGSKTGQAQRITLAADEELIQLSGRGNGGSVTALRLLSSTVDGSVRLHGPYGAGEVVVKEGGEVVEYADVELIVGGSDASGFSWYGGKIMAFLGHTRDHRLAGLGVATAPIVEVDPALTSTSVLSSEYRTPSGGGKLESYPVYRSTLVLPDGTKQITLWAEEQLSVVIEGQALVLDPVKPTVVAPNLWSKLTLTVEAASLAVPAIKVRTDQMSDPWQWYTLHPDVAVQTKIAGWDADTLYANREALGIDEDFTREDCAAVQAAVVNIARLGLPGDGQAAHERRIDAGAMDDSDWVLDLEGDDVVYKTGDAAGQAKQQATNVTRVTASSGLKKLIKKGKKASNSVSKVVVETATSKPVTSVVKTVEKAGGDKVVASAATLGKDAAAVGKQLGKDIAKGDVEGLGKHLGKGSLELGRDVTKLGKHALVTVIKVGGEAVEFVLDRTVALGKLLLELLESLGAELLKLINFLVDLIPWKAIGDTQKQLMEVLERTLGGLAEADTTPIVAEVAGVLDGVRKSGGAALDKLTLDLGGKVEPSGGISKLGGAASDKAKSADKATGKVMKLTEKVLSKPIELVTWLINKVLEKIPVIGPIAEVLAAAAGRMGDVLAELVTALGKTAKAMAGPLGASVTNLLAILKHPADAPNYIASAVLQLVKGLMDASIELVEQLVGVVLHALQGLAQVLLDLGTVDLFPGHKQTKGKIPFITDFYNFIVGGNLSLFKLVTFFLAIPIALIHEVVFGSAPNLKLPAKRSSARNTGLIVASGVCSLAELSINTYLDASTLIKGVKKYSNVETGQRQTLAEENDALVLPLEVASLVCSALAFGLTSPLEFDAKPKKDEDIINQVFFWIDAAQLGFDIFGLIKDNRRMVRADLVSESEGREGAYGTLAFESLMLIAKVSLAATYDRFGCGFASDMLSGTGGVIEAALLSVFADNSPTAAKVSVASNAAFGLAALGTGLAADLK